MFLRGESWLEKWEGADARQGNLVEMGDSVPVVVDPGWAGWQSGAGGIPFKSVCSTVLAMTILKSISILAQTHSAKNLMSYM